MENIEQILTGCKRGERLSQEKLYKQLYPVLFSLCKNFFDEKHDVLTAVNNGMLRVFQNIGHFDPSKGEFFNWAYTIVRNAALTMLRDRKTQGFDYVEINEAMGFESRENPLDVLHAGDIQVYLMQLPVATRRICGLYYLDGFSVREISEALDIRDGTVKWHLSESRSRLKSIIEKALR
ncbi:RNA polymerase sigma factor [Dyadobacter sediminis]|uniref:Sigma-70 family RNA polymerase sigma factor n=1 Tax=Dyadobacter sediminis TaxID=1493691 RepID=A0A5R9KIK6_9BACT|nr:sigma-70 family RNA polymerase sigma factor [Dyadobacter sediminis]TLU96050.1 sigma-70 family RNA polymerase sigma factor [Dyadobacter sediminis]